MSARIRYYPMILLSAYTPILILLTYSGETRMDVYYSLFIILYLIITELMIPPVKKYRRRILPLIIVLLVIFSILVAKRILEVLGVRI